jgi:5'(3')-deoxyribonucleotidase
MRWLARRLNKLQQRGYIIGIISWNCKNASNDYEAKVIEAKMRWLAKHLPSVQFDEIHIVPYGTPKYEVAEIKEAILFDDELQNLLDWGGEPVLAGAIDETLKHLLQYF